MKNKGLIIFIAIVFALTCTYQLSFTWVVKRFEAKAKTFATKNGVYDGDVYRNYIDSLGRKPLLNLGIIKKDYFFTVTRYDTFYKGRTSCSINIEFLCAITVLINL